MEREQQLAIEECHQKISSCAFSGHRILEADFDREKLKTAIEEFIGRGVKIFYCGMAVGFDLCAAECVLELKKKFPEVKLVACVPCADQEKNFSPLQRQRYEKILANCEVKVILSENYYRGCMLRRNEYMADRADALIAYCRKKEGGTAYTLKCFEKRKKPVFQI